MWSSIFSIGTEIISSSVASIRSAPMTLGVPRKTGETKTASPTLSSGERAAFMSSPNCPGGVLQIKRTGMLSAATPSRIDATTVMQSSTGARLDGGPGMTFSMSRACMFMMILN